ncbi:TetR/AcrR family transcriptional regulator [Amycolatopsis stemonae]
MQGSAEPDTRDDWLDFGAPDLSPILAATLDVMYEHGFHGATVRDIARRVGLTVPALYYHHESKEGLFVALLEVGTGEVAWRVRAAAAEAPGRPDLQFVNVVRAVVLHMTHHTRLAALDQELRYLSPANRKRYAARRKEVETALVDIVGAGIEEGYFLPRDARETARALLGMCQSVGRWYSPDGPLTPDEVAERYIDIALLTVGIEKRPGPRPVRRRRAR